jgi:hypothetical protein
MAKRDIPEMTKQEKNHNSYACHEIEHVLNPFVLTDMHVVTLHQ